VADPYKVDADGNPGAEAESTGEWDPRAEAALRRQIAATLRFMTLSTVVGVVIIAILAVVLKDSRGVMILIGIVYLVTSVVAQLYLRRSFENRLKRGMGAQTAAPADDAPPTIS
jgi:ABC-type bacteriocin/lantibiotic exporter with double-glycine peptidase domain